MRTTQDDLRSARGIVAGILLSAGLWAVAIAVVATILVAT